MHTATLTGQEQWRADPRFIDTAARHRHRVELQEEIDAVLMRESSAHWLRLLHGKVPAAPVLDVAEALENPFVIERGMPGEVAHPERPAGLRTLSSPIQIDGRRGPDRRAPALGEHDGEFD